MEKKIDCPIHVDAASGGFVAPFIAPDLSWDFRLEKVVSINVSGHKYGLVSHCVVMSMLNTITDHSLRCIPVWGGVSGGPLNFYPKNSSSTSTIWGPIKPL